MNKILSIIRDLAFTAIMLWITSPYMAFLGNWFMYAILWGVWILLAWLTNPKAFKMMMSSRYTFVALVWPFFVLFLDVLGWSVFSPYQFTIAFLVISVIFYIDGGHKTSLLLIILIYLIYMVAINVFSAATLVISPNVARTLAQSDKDVTIEFAHPLMANFAHINAISLISILYVALIKTKKVGMWSKVVYLVLMILNAYVLILAQYSLSLITFLLFALFILFVNYKRPYRGVIWIFFGIITLFIVGGPVLLALSEDTNSVLFSNRLRSLGLFFSDGTIESGSDFQERLQLYSLSINTFFNNPIIGVGGAEFEAGGLVGGHSEIFDRFAYYGLIGGVFFLCYITSLYKNIARFFKGQDHFNYLMLFLAFITINIFNPGYQEAILFVLFFVAPALLFLSSHREYI